MSQNVRSSGNFNSDLFHRLHVGEAAGLAPSISRNPLLNDYHWAKESPFTFSTSFIVQKGSPLLVRIQYVYLFLYLTFYFFQSIFENSILWLQDTGILKRLLDDILKPLVFKTYPKARQKMPLTINQLSFIMILFVIGIALSILIFIYEFKTSTRAKGIKNSNPINLLDMSREPEKRATYEMQSASLFPYQSIRWSLGRTIVVNHK